LVASLEAVLRPVIEQQYASQIGDVADLVSKNFAFGLTKKFDLGKSSGPIATMPNALKGKKDFENLARSPLKQQEFLQQPLVKAAIAKAVQAEIERPGQESVDPKFLLQEN
jgi:hypothetical protein